MRFELTTTGATSRRSVHLSYGHTDHDRNRTCITGFADPHLAIRSRGPIKRAGQGSNLPLPDLEAGVPPLELPAHCCTFSRCVGRDLNPHVSPKRGRGYGPLHCHSATYAKSEPSISQRGRIRTFDLVRPRHARCQATPHAEILSCSRWESNPSFAG